MENESRSIVILYGSETGSSQDLAENLARQAKRRHFKTRVYAMDDYDRVYIHVFSLYVDLIVYVESTSRRKARCLYLLNSRARRRTC
jgi:sulfite reductase alpha subunit-like flavoprotein